MMANVALLNAIASALAVPQLPCSAKFNIATEATFVLNEIKKITAPIVPVARMKLNVKAAVKFFTVSGTITSVKTRRREPPSEITLSSTVVFICEKAVLMVLYEIGKYSTIIDKTIIVRVPVSFKNPLNASTYASPISGSGIAVGSVAKMSSVLRKGIDVRIVKKAQKLARSGVTKAAVNAKERELQISVL